MSAAGDERYLQDLLLLTLKGRVMVYFIDGNRLEGNFATQDAWNIFVTVDDEPMMIPRSQIMYIKGAPGQPIERDTSQQAFLEDKAISTPEESRRVDEGATAVEATSVVEPETMDSLSPESLQVASEAGRRGASVFDESVVEETGEEEPDMTFVLPDTADLSAELEKMAEPEADLDDLTLVLDEEEDEDEITYVFEDEEESGAVAELTCTTGPHVGEHFELRGEIITLGRSRDNDIPLWRDKEISRRHSIIKREEDRFVIQDHNSLNGTYVNNERVDTPRTLADGDTVLIGVSDMQFEIK